MSVVKNDDPGEAGRSWLFDDHRPTESTEVRKPRPSDNKIEVDGSMVVCRKCLGEVTKDGRITGGRHGFFFMTKKGLVRSATALCTCLIGRWLKTTKGYSRIPFFTDLPTGLIDRNAETYERIRQSVREAERRLRERRPRENPAHRADPDYHREGGEDEPEGFSEHDERSEPNE